MKKSFHKTPGGKVNLFFVFLFTIFTIGGFYFGSQEGAFEPWEPAGSLPYAAAKITTFLLLPAVLILSVYQYTRNKDNYKNSNEWIYCS